MPNPVKGRPGYTNSTITITTTPASYAGDGVNGWAGGTDYSFNVAEREIELVRARQDTTDGPFLEGVGAPVGKRIRLKGYFKGTLIPPISIENEFIKITARVVLEIIAVIMVERFRETGVVNGGAIEWEVEGTTDGTFTDAA